jgi:D-3-phosphoglycerate dehydrogenase / 2-oxoglutarate reductase
MNQPIYIIDFDSTFTKVEALDELAAIALINDVNKDEIVNKIKDITTAGMAGTMGFAQTLQERIVLLKSNKKDIAKLVTVLQEKISDSFLRNKNFIEQNAENIYIVSGGFKEYIVPIVTQLGVAEKNIYANTFLYDAQDNIIGYDTTNILAQDKGKVKLLQKLNLQGELCIIGDGYTDYEVREAGLANTFYMFTENVQRDALLPKADKVIASLDEFLFINNLNRSQSYPKHKIKVLLLENLHSNAIAIFNNEHYSVEIIKEALDEKDLIEKIKDVHILGIRSKTNVNKNVLAHAKKLMCIGAFCIGTNQIDTEACTAQGVVVYNAPFSNTRSVVELAIGEMILLMRNTITKSNLMHKGTWDKSAVNSYEIRGKILGIVGYGNIGAQLSVLAEALGMQVIFYDVADKLALGNAKKCNTLHELLGKADVVTMHVDGRKENTNLINAAAFDVMKQNVIFLNLSRGHIVDLAELRKAIESGKVWGASLDVYPYEPKSNNEKFISDLQHLPNVILTPHIGGSTEEAQANIGEFVPYKIINYINKGDTYGAVNFPEVQLPTFENAHRILHIHKNEPGILAKINAVFAKYNVNIVAQFLKTHEQIGYVITDIAKDYNNNIIEEIKQLEGTLRFRMLY